MKYFPGDSRPRINRTVSGAIRSLSKPLIGGLSALWLIALPLQAAETAADAETSTLQEVVVTGSRIPVPANISATSPVVAVSSQDIRLQGNSDSIDVLNALPQNIIASAADLGNNNNPLSSAGGVATADLRGLGPQRTLVLVDGKRLGDGDPNTLNPNPAPDLDQIPAAMIERVDVVTGGASAVYGSDAMAGVVNFIMKKNFEGVQIDGQFSEFQHSNHQTGLQAIDAKEAAATGSALFNAPTGSVRDGERRDASILIGTNVADGKGNFTGYFTYHNQDPVRYGARDYSACEEFSNGDPNTGFTCLGSSNSNEFSIKGKNYSVIGNQFLPYPNKTSSPPASFNSNVYEYGQRQDVRYNAGFMSHLELNDYVKPYLNVSFMNDRSTEVVGPSALFKNAYPFSADNLYRVNCTNPLLSAQEQSILCTPAQIAADTANPGSAAGQAAVNIGRRNIEGGGRINYYEHTNYRIVFGATGDVIDGVSYDAYGQYYYTSLFQAADQYLNFANIGQALIATGTAANPKCVNPIGGCVPYNLFTQGGVTPAQLAYLQSPGTIYGTNSEGIAHVDFTADFGKYGITSPFAHDGIALNIGGEHRYETLNVAPDAVALANELSGFVSTVPVAASFHVNEVFAEARVPIMQDKPFVHDLDLDAGYRFSSYSTAGTTQTYKFELQYAPTEDIRLRYSYDRAERAPNLNELYVPQAYGQQSFLGIDPCAGATPTATLAQCEHTGVTPAQYGTITQCISGQCGQVIGGNPKLKPEQADTYSVGITLTPTFLPGFSGSVDYYHIAFFDLIGTLPGANVFTTCLTVGTPFDCAQVVRNPITGALFGATVAGGGYILQTSVNTGSSVASGIDVQFNYRYPTDRWGQFSANMNGAWLEHNTTTPYPGAATFDCAGLFGPNCNTNAVLPRWRHTLRVNWEMPWDKVLVSANWRFIGATGFDNDSKDPSLQFSEFGAYDYVMRRIPNYSYLDLSVIVPVWRGIEVRGGVNNVLDKDPPILDGSITGTGSPNTYPTYDLLGRQFFVGFTAKF
jgi:iron complex outermembrane receptor protein